MRKLLAYTIFFNLMISLSPILGGFCQAQVNPWPRATTLPFPWDTIQGTWTEKSSLYTFSFQVIQNSWGSRHIKIRQVDPRSGATLAQGVGYERSDYVVVAAMSGGQQKQYLLTIRLLQGVYCWDKRNMTGVTIESYDHQLMSHFEIHKVAEIPLTPANVQEYKIPHPDSFEPVPMCWVEGSTRQ